MHESKPTLVLMAGLPGSGKSTLAIALGRRLGWGVLDKDTIKSSLLDLGAEEELAAQASYVLLHELAEDLIVGQGLSVILDTPSSYERVFRTCSRIAEAANGVLCVVLCEATRETRMQRLVARNPRPSHVTTIDDEAEAEIQRRFQNLPKDALRLSTEGPMDEVLDEVVSYVLTPR